MPDSYITNQGDTWDAIAFKLWKKESLFQHLVAANPEHLDVLVFPAGVVLAIPEIIIPTQKMELPPWMIA